MKNTILLFLHYVIAWPLTIIGRPIIAFYDWTVMMLGKSPAGFSGYMAPPPPPEKESKYQTVLKMARLASEDPDTQFKLFAMAIKSYHDQQRAQPADIFEEWQSVVRPINIYNRMPELPGASKKFLEPDIQKFWVTVEHLFRNGRLIKNVHLQVDGDILYIDFITIYDLYNEELKKQNAMGLDKRILYNALRNHDHRFIPHLWHTKGNKGRHVLAFHYGSLGLDLVKKM